MKKFILGVAVGMAVTVAGSAYADDVVESIVGKTIQGQFPVKVAGKQLNKQAAVVDGTSYLPVRAIGEALNMDVKFNADLGIELSAKGVSRVEETTITTPDQGVDVQTKIDELKKKIADEKGYIEYATGIRHSNELILNEPNAPKESVQKAIDMYTQQIADAEKRIAEYESQIAALQAQQ